MTPQEFVKKLKQELRQAEMHLHDACYENDIYQYGYSEGVVECLGDVIVRMEELL